MADFNCELAALIGDELLFVSGWAAADFSADQRFVVEAGGRGGRDITRDVFRYHRGDIEGDDDRPAPAAGVMAICRADASSRRNPPTLLVTGGGARPKRVVFTRIEAGDLVDHLYPRFPYFLTAYADEGVARSPAGRALLRAFFGKYPGGVKPSAGHRAFGDGGTLGVSLERSWVVRRGPDRLLIVSGHVASSTLDTPLLRWDESAPELGSFCLEEASGDGIDKLQFGELRAVTRFVGVLPLAPSRETPSVITLHVSAGGHTLPLVVPVTAVVSAEELARDLDPAGATAVLEMIARNRSEPDSSGDDFLEAIAASTLAASELPMAAETSEDDAASRLTIDAAFVLSDDCVVAFGWALSAPPELTCHGPAGTAWCSRRVSCWMERQDVVKMRREAGAPLSDPHVGFVAVFDGLRKTASGGGTDRLYFSVDGGSRRRLRCRPLRVERDESDPATTMRKVLARIGAYPPERWLPDLAPHLARAWSERARPVPAIETVDLGPAPERPEVSIVVPLYGRMDLLEYQLACFAGDASMANAELIYFVDHPERSDEALALAGRSFELFGVPFRVLTSSVNLGFAGANNRAVEHARAPVVLLMNSDVMPKEHGWLPRLLATHRALPTPGALGPRLVFEDGSIQHAGMAFEAQKHGGTLLWFNAHPFKGLSPRLLGKKGLEQVAAITGACLMVNKDLYQSVGGLSEDFVQADFEDSDFCLRLRERDLACYVSHDVELYHLERQSVPAAGKPPLRNARTFVNAWIQTHRWGSVLCALGEPCP